MTIIPCFAILVVTSLTNMRIWLETNIINQCLYYIYIIFHNLIETRTDNKWFPLARNGYPRNRENIAAILCNCLGFPVSIVIIVVMVLASRKNIYFSIRHHFTWNLLLQKQVWLCKKTRENPTSHSAAITWDDYRSVGSLISDLLPNTRNFELVSKMPKD